MYRVSRQIGGKGRRPRRTLKDFPFVGSGSSIQEKGRPVSEDHDEALAEIIDEERRP